MKTKVLTQQYFLLFLSVLLLCSCKKEFSQVASNQQVDTNQHVDIYIAGVDSGVATYWKNGSPIHLPGGTTHSWANSIVVSGNDVYVPEGQILLYTRTETKLPNTGKTETR
jgi:hypothetical protein